VSTERYVDPAVGQALEQAREALSTERSTQEQLAGERVELQGKAERLQAERDQLRAELERLREGRPGRVPRLPELRLPFEVRPPVPFRRRVRDALPVLMVLVLPFAVVWSKKLSDVAMLGFVLLMILSQFLTLRHGRSRWRFSELGIEATQQEVQGALVRYTDVVGVEAYSSKSQRLWGVGSVGVTYQAVSGEQKLLTLKDVPEPDRLAEWLRLKCPKVV
jgi:hypothetical protein